MAEVVVFGALCKIGSVLASSASITMFARLDAKLTIISEIESRIKQIEVELKLMQAFLRQAQNQEGYNEPTEVYLQEVRNLASEIEDIMDEFIYLSVRHNSKFFTGEFLSYFRKLGKSPWHKIARELKDLQSHLQNLRDLRVQYEIQLPGGDRASASTDDHCLPLYLSHPANDMVGIEKERTKLMQWLTARLSSTSVIAVWGMGGSGKTTLVNIMYEDEMIKNQFDCHIWITVSQKFNAYGIIRKVIRHILKGACPSDIDTVSGRDLIQILQRTLQQRKFMLVLDDVWSVDVWMDLASIIGNNNVSGNKVVITTRIKEVASLASEDQVIELHKLNEADSWSLFCRWAFKSCRDRSCPQEMEQLGREIIDKCDGLPLAIVTVGNTLSFKKPVTEEWSKYYDHLIWELRDKLHGQELNSVMKILNLSYKHLPSHLKNTFVFCSIFPEDYMMTKKRLVRLWVAEGLVKPEKRRTIEEVAEEYLNELIDRCLLKVVERKHFRKVKEFQMHDIVRELAISISEKETFCMTYSKSQPSESEYKCRRLSIHEHSDRFQPLSYSSRLRSLYQFDASCSSFPSVSTQRTGRYLNVLELQDAAITVLPEEVSSLFNLRYLGLRRTKIRQLPRSIEKLFNLQTIDVYLTNVEKLPAGITKLKRVRHLLAGKTMTPLFGVVEKTRGVETPKGSWGSMELQTLKGVLASMDLVVQLGSMTQLRTLSIGDVRDAHHPKFSASISNMRFLRTLKVVAAEGNYINFQELNSPPQNLRKLCLEGRLHQSVIESHFFQIVGNRLEKLTLLGSKLRSDPFASFSHLSNLAVLEFIGAYVGESVLFESGWLPKLHTLVMGDLVNVKSVVMERQTVQNLQWLALFKLPELKEAPHGIEFLVSLQNLMLVDMHDEFMEGIQGEDKARVQHISTVRYFDRSRRMEVRLFQDP
ncbi:hypothetical protein QYE76_032590 [Lolium multiflorum]|uniref:Uncharacterized protein n=1 Tax=Lolium multiflorum TaxID=4521 RepID=A0AAD8QUE1_LOLMU|nr:hypothetical protein QYE76_032590 [Lolium multiflorum]